MTNKLSALFSVSLITTVALMSTSFASKAEAITVQKDYQGPICIYVPKGWLIKNKDVNLQVRWGAYTGEYPLNVGQLTETISNSGLNAGLEVDANAGLEVDGASASVAGKVNGGYNNSSSRKNTYGANPNFGVQLQANGDNVENIDTTFPVVGFEQQECKSDFNVPIY